MRLSEQSSSAAMHGSLPLTAHLALPGPVVLGLVEIMGAGMAFSIGARNFAGTVSFCCATESATVDKVLELEQRGYRDFTIKDGAGRTVGLDELSAQCEAGED
jgi:hypothetical protein